MSGIKHRMNRIFRENGKAFIMAMDHGTTFNVLPALKRPDRVISEVARAGADAFLATVGMVDKFADSFLGRGIILRLDGGISYLGDNTHPVQSVVTAEEPRLGADS
jgi:DhnA family fructose-bisphosphate aldolase class Ia